jgi:hypothetical protein
VNLFSCVWLSRVSLKRFPTEKCWAGRVRVAGSGPLQPCRNGAIARRGRKKRRPAQVPGLRDANARVRFSVGNYFGTDARKTFGTHAMRGASRERIAAHAARFRFVPSAHAAEAKPIGHGRPNGQGVENEPGEWMNTFLDGEFGVQTCSVLRGA